MLGDAGRFLAFQCARHFDLHVANGERRRQAQHTHANLNDLGAAVRQMARLPLSESSNPKIANEESIKSDADLVALMVAGFCDNHSQSLTTIDESAPRASEDSLPNADSRNPHSTMTFDEDCGCLIAIDEAERGGFEPPVPLRARRFSRPVHSTALPSLRKSLTITVYMCTSYYHFVDCVFTGFIYRNRWDYPCPVTPTFARKKSEGRSIGTPKQAAVPPFISAMSPTLCSLTPNVFSPST